MRSSSIWRKVVTFPCAMVLVGTLVAWSAQRVSAAPPHYWVLRAPAEVSKFHHERGYYPAKMSYLSRNVYAYGWFGVPPRQHWVRHEGYRHQYVQWRKR